MSREWEPGEIVVGLLDGNEIVGIVRGGGKRMFYADSVTTDQVDLKHVRNLRRLAVIDPEDREQAGRLAELVENCGDENHCVQYPCGSLSCWTDRIADALREFANPTPPKCGSSITVQYGDGKGCNYTCTLAAEHDGMHSCGDNLMWGGAA